MSVVLPPAMPHEHDAGRVWAIRAGVGHSAAVTDHVVFGVGVDGFDHDVDLLHGGQIV
ncbi:MAG: hypothetical protein R2873_21525 [Caldilineaceae bacterium]